MLDWSPHLFTAFKSLKQGDHAVAVGMETPYLKTLDHAVQLVRGNKAPTPRYFMFQKEGQVHFGEWGRLTERLGRDHPYCVDGPDQNGRPIKYFQSFSAPKGTPIPSYAWLKNNQDWFRQELDTLVRAFNESNDAERSTKLNKLARVPDFQEAYEYGDNFWDRMAQKIHAGEKVNGVVLPEIESHFPDIGEQVKGVLTETGEKKNGHISIADQAKPIHRNTKPTKDSSAVSPKASRTPPGISWERAPLRHRTLFVGAAVVASIGLIAGLHSWRQRTKKSPSSALGQVGLHESKINHVERLYFRENMQQLADNQRSL